MKKPNDKLGRTNQLIHEIGIPLLKQASEALTTEEHAKRYLVDAHWYKILKQFDNDDLMVGRRDRLIRVGNIMLDFSDPTIIGSRLDS